MNMGHDRTETTGSTEIGHAFNFKPNDLNRIMKVVRMPFTFNHNGAEVKASILAISRISADEIDIYCEDSATEYEIGFNIKSRSARVKNATPIPVRPALQV